MGIRPEERDGLVATINTTAGEELDGHVDQLLEVALPMHRVQVRPFFAATRVERVEACVHAAGHAGDGESGQAQ